MQHLTSSHQAVVLIVVQHLRQVCERPSIVTTCAVFELRCWQFKYVVKAEQNGCPDVQLCN